MFERPGQYEHCYYSIRRFYALAISSAVSILGIGVCRAHADVGAARNATPCMIADVTARSFLRCLAGRRDDWRRYRRGSAMRFFDIGDAAFPFIAEARLAAFDALAEE